MCASSLMERAALYESVRFPFKSGGAYQRFSHASKNSACNCAEFDVRLEMLSLSFGAGMET